MLKRIKKIHSPEEKEVIDVDSDENDQIDPKMRMEEEEEK